MTLLLSGKPRNTARKNFACFSDKTGKSFNIREIKIQRRF